MIYPPGATSKSIDVGIYDDTGLPVTGLIASTIPSLYWTIAGNTAATAISLSDLAAITTAYASGGVKERTGSAGIYRLDIPDAALAGAGDVRIYGEASGKHLVCEPITVGYIGANAMQWLGGTIPAVNVTGVPLVDAKYLLGTIFATPATAGVVDVNAKAIGGTTQTARDIGLSVLLSSGTGTGQVSLSSGLVDITQTAADKSWSTAARVLTAGTNIALAKGTGVTGFNDIAATAIVSSGAITTSGGAVSTVTTVGTLTTYTGNTVQTGDSYARIGSAGAGLTALGDTRIVNLDAAITSRMATFTLPTNFSTLGITAGGKISGVVLVDTTSANTDMRGTDSAALAATALSTTQWTNGRAVLLDNLDAAISSRSTYAGGDTSGTTTLLARLTNTRATLLDNLDAAITTRLASASYTAPNNADIATLVARLTSTRAALMDNLSELDAAISSRASATELAKVPKTGQTNTWTNVSHTSTSDTVVIS